MSTDTDYVITKPLTGLQNPLYFRLLLVQKYGGFYADTDYVITKPLTGLQNVLASDQGSCYKKGKTIFS